MKILATVLVSLGLLAACAPQTDQQKEAVKLRELCEKGNNKATLPECAQFVGGGSN